MPFSLAGPQNFVDSLQEGVILFDASFRAMLWNQAAKELLGVTDAQLSAVWHDPPFELLTPDLQPVEVEARPTSRAATTKAPVTRERLAVRHATGEIRELLVSATPRLDQFGHLESVLVTFVDVTRELSATEALRASERFFERSGDLYFVLDQALRVVRANHAARSLWALDGDATRQPFLELLEPAERERVKHRLSAADAQSTDFLALARTPAGARSIRWNVARNATQGLEAAHFVRGQDLTERAREQAELSRSRTLLADAFQLAELAVLERNLKTGDSLATGKLKELLELDERAVHIDFERFVVPEDRADFADAKQGEARPRVLRLVTSKGHAREVRVWVRLSDEHELLVVQDVTEQSLIQAQLRLAERLTSLGTMAAGVAHEINNPLAFVLANLNVVKGDLARLPELEGVDVTDLRAAVNEAIEGAERMRQIVQGLKPFTRVDEHQRGACDVARIVQASLNMAKNELRHRARIVSELRPVPPVFANEARLGQVFLNLLVNAAHAIVDGNANQNLVTVTTRHDGEWVVVSVSDTGRGIEPEQLPRIFDPFFTTKPIGQGTGLGLFISQGIVKEAGGSMHVTSTPGVGTTFEVRLPVSSLAFAGSPTTPLPARSRLRMLVIDDEPSILRALERLLGKAHELTSARTGHEALALLKAGLAYDVVLCDLMMPELSGMQVWEQLEPAQRKKVIFMTGGTFTAEAQRFLASQAFAVLEKPFTTASLEEALRALQTR